MPEFPIVYPPVDITNSTGFSVSGRVHYATPFCRDDNYRMEPYKPWRAGSRGACLVTRITASVVTPNGIIAATPFASTGSTHSSFAVIQISNNPFAFEVTRRMTGAEDQRPEDYVEPTTEQN